MNATQLAKLADDHAPLAICLSAAVPLNILEMERQGGPTPAQWQEARDFAEVLASKADVLMYGGGKKNEAAALFNQIARALAVMAFVPGGVHFAGISFCRHHPHGRLQASRLCERCLQEEKR